jgi:NAD(P)-dependent dehydrogenase (short-subunit alcohol dehydrogenase family)
VSSTYSASGTPIEGAVALVRGGNRGFGRALVDGLLEREAAKMYATSRSAQPHPPLDVVDDTSVAAAAHAATDVSILVNDGGISLATPVLKAPLSAMRDELETNLFGLIRVARAFAPVLAEQPRGSMVNVLSALSWLSFGRGYEISKAAGTAGRSSRRREFNRLPARTTLARRSASLREP